MVLPSPSSRATFIGLTGLTGCTKQSNCYGHRLYGWYWIEQTIEGDAYLHVDTVVNWRPGGRAPLMFGFAVDSFDKEYKMERMVAT